MTRRDPRPVEAAARFCLSCAGTLACWCVWLVLVALLAVQLYIALAKELPVPQFVLQRLESRLAEENLAAAFARAQFDPSGKLLLESVQVRLRQFQDPLLTARSIYARKNFWSLVSGARLPDEIRVDGGSLLLPAPLSPSGTPEALVSNLSLTIRPQRSLVTIDQLAFRVGHVAVTVRGELQLPSRTAPAEGAFADLLMRALQSGRWLARDLPQLEALEHPVVDVVLSVRPGIGNVAEITVLADSLIRPRGLDLETGPLRATAVVRLDGSDARPMRLEFATSHARYRDLLAATGVQGTVVTEVAPRVGLDLPYVALELAAARVSGWNETVSFPHLQGRWQPDVPLELRLEGSVHGEIMGVEARADLARRSAEVRFEGHVPPSLVTEVLTPRAPRLAPYFDFGDPVWVRATAQFEPGWQFSRLSSRVRGGRLNSNGVQVTSTRGRIDLDRAGNFLASEAAVTAGTNHARGSYAMNFFSRDFRMLLEGALQPPDIAGWFRSRWWLDFWEKIQFPGAAPSADVDVAGNWRDPRQVTYFGSTLAGPARVLGADLESAAARVFVRPHYAHAFALEAVRAGGTQRARGWFKRHADYATRTARAFEFDLAGNFDADALRRLGAPTAEGLLAPWQFTQPPEIEFHGRTDFVAGTARPRLEFRGRAAGGVKYDGFPLDAVSASGAVEGDEVRLDKIELDVAGGRGTAKATLNGTGADKRIGFDFYVEQADLVRAIRAMHEYEGNRHPDTERPASPNAELLKRASGGRLNFALSAQGAPADLASFTGSGNLEIHGAELGEIHLFGLLSQVLSGLSLNFSSLKLDTLRGSYHVADGRVNFPDLRVTGSTAVIEARGDYRLVDRTLDFSARLRPYEENRNIITGVIGIVMNPLTSILELRLTGPIRDPNWSISLGSSGPRESPLPPQGGSAGAANVPPPQPKSP